MQPRVGTDHHDVAAVAAGERTQGEGAQLVLLREASFPFLKVRAKVLPFQ